MKEKNIWKYRCFNLVTKNLLVINLKANTFKIDNMNSCMLDSGFEFRHWVLYRFLTHHYYRKYFHLEFFWQVLQNIQLHASLNLHLSRRIKLKNKVNGNRIEWKIIIPLCCLANFFPVSRSTVRFGRSILLPTIIFGICWYVFTSSCEKKLKNRYNVIKKLWNSYFLQPSF